MRFKRLCRRTDYEKNRFRNRVAYQSSVASSVTKVFRISKWYTSWGDSVSSWLFFFFVLSTVRECHELDPRWREWVNIWSVPCRVMRQRVEICSRYRYVDDNGESSTLISANHRLWETLRNRNDFADGPVQEHRDPLIVIILMTRWRMIRIITIRRSRKIETFIGTIVMIMPWYRARFRQTWNRQNSQCRCVLVVWFSTLRGRIATRYMLVQMIGSDHRSIDKIHTLCEWQLSNACKTYGRRKFSKE